MCPEKSLGTKYFLDVMKIVGRKNVRPLKNFGSEKNVKSNIFFLSNEVWFRKNLVHNNWGPQKIGFKKFSNSWDIPDMDKCRLDKCCIDKCHRSSAGDGWPSPGSRCPCAWPHRRPFKHSTWPNKLISRRKTMRIDCVSLPVEVPLDVPDLVHLVAQQGSELDPKCDT